MTAYSRISEALRQRHDYRLNFYTFLCLYECEPLLYSVNTSSFNVLMLALIYRFRERESE